MTGGGGGELVGTNELRRRFCHCSSSCSSASRLVRGLMRPSDRRTGSSPSTGASGRSPTGQASRIAPSAVRMMRGRPPPRSARAVRWGAGPAVLARSRHGGGGGGGAWLAARRGRTAVAAAGCFEAGGGALGADRLTPGFPRLTPLLAFNTAGTEEPRHSGGSFFGTGGDSFGKAWDGGIEVESGSNRCLSWWLWLWL